MTCIVITNEVKTCAHGSERD
jgi:hypothetical protein